MIRFEFPRLQAYLNQGPDQLDPKDHCGVRLCNLLSLVATIASLGFAAFSLLHDTPGLMAPALECTLPWSSSSR